MTETPGRLGPTVAGTWYPADAGELERQIDACLRGERALRPPDNLGDGRALALVAPHAGLAYSGAVAGAGFRALAGQSRHRVLLIGPSHYAGFQGAAVPAATRYRTPLGELPLDRQALGELAAHPSVMRDDGPFLPEHSLEAEIPFLQRTLAGRWKLLPVLIGGGSSLGSLSHVAEALRPYVDPDTIIVVSSDFTHFGPRFGYVPFDRDVPGRVEALDRGAIDLVLAGDRQGFDEYIRSTGATVCGRSAIDVLLRLLPSTDARQVAYDTSGRITGDWVHSVSYASLLFRAAAIEPAGP